MVFNKIVSNRGHKKLNYFSLMHITIKHGAILKIIIYYSLLANNMIGQQHFVHLYTKHIWVVFCCGQAEELQGAGGPRGR